MSFTHRSTGVALVFGTFVLAWWLIAAAAGPGPFGVVQAVISSWFGRLLLFGWTFALFYHLCNGIRHMCWDAGKCLEISALYASGWVVVITSTSLTLAAWILGYAAMGVL